MFTRTLRCTLVISLSLGLVPIAFLPAQANSHLNCDAYAQTAVDQQLKNVQLKCGFTGPAWQANYNNHKNWCNDPARTIGDVSIEDANRKNALKQCGTKIFIIKPFLLKDCEKYAQNAVDQQVKNEQLQCGFSGPAWQANYLAHRNWCAGSNVTFQLMNQETQNRGLALIGCLNKP